jgi:hypothetical protein
MKQKALVKNIENDSWCLNRDINNKHSDDCYDKYTASCTALLVRKGVKVAEGLSFKQKCSPITYLGYIST